MSQQTTDRVLASVQPQRELLPWSGTLDFPPGGVNGMYKTITLKRRDGSTFQSIGKKNGFVRWANEQIAHLVSQHFPDLPYQYRVMVLFEFRFPSDQHDVDGPLKSSLDILQDVTEFYRSAKPRLLKKRRGVMTPVAPPCWNDRHVSLVLAHKQVCPDDVGVHVYIAPYTTQRYRRIVDALMQPDQPFLVTQGGDHA